MKKYKYNKDSEIHYCETKHCQIIIFDLQFFYLNFDIHCKWTGDVNNYDGKATEIERNSNN